MRRREGRHHRAGIGAAFFVLSSDPRELERGGAAAGVIILERDEGILQTSAVLASSLDRGVGRVVVKLTVCHVALLQAAGSSHHTTPREERSDESKVSYSAVLCCAVLCCATLYYTIL